MKCPKCHNEVLNQRICPYCGGTVFLEEPSLKMENSRYGVFPERNAGPGAAYAQEDMEQRIGKMETKINLILIMVVSQFFLMLLYLVMALSAG